MDEKIFQITKIIKRYSKSKNFKQFFKNLCFSLYPYRNILKKEHLLKIIDKKIPLELVIDKEKFSYLFRTIQKFEEFNFWPIHIYNLIFLLIDIIKESNHVEDTINSLMDLLERLLIF